MEYLKTNILINGLPKISLNKWYAGTHWNERHKMTNTYKLIIRSQCKEKFNKKNKYSVSYNFGFKKSPLDAMNCAAMAKLIEDVIFENDKWDIVRSVTLSSTKHDEDTVLIIVEEIK